MDKFLSKTTGNHSETIEDISNIAQWFNISKDDAEKWVEKKTTFQNILNLSSEDAVIVHFIVPFFRNALNYEATEIDVKPELTMNQGRQVKKIGGQSDIVIRKKNAPVIVIEAKSYGHKLKSDKEDAEGQAFDYSRANELKPRPKYYMCTNVQETHIYDTITREELDFSPIREYEFAIKYKQLSKVISKNNIFPLGSKPLQPPIVRVPITDQREFERILFKCQDEMREASESKTGIVAFAEMNKLLFIKLLEDRREREGKENRFTLSKVQEEGENYVRGTLFKDIVDYYLQKKIRIFRPEDEIKLDDVTINRIVEKLEKIILVDENGNVYPPVAHVYESFVSTIFRGENGQYFTPRNIVDFMVKMVQVSWGNQGLKIVDPACGSGGFLLSAFMKMDTDLRNKFMNKGSDGRLSFINEVAEEEYSKAKRKLCEELLIGFDNEEIVAKTATMNMSVHGDGSTGIYYGDSLKKEDYKFVLKPTTFDIALTNPPFSSNVKKGSHIDIDGIDVLSKFELGYSHKFDPEKNMFDFSINEISLKQQDSKVLFIERCWEILNPAGVLGIIVDDGVLNNVSDDYVRDFIYRNFVIKAIISLPYDIFKEQDAHNYTSILFLQKKKDGLTQGDVFMAIAEHCGENYGKSTTVMSNDLETILKDYLPYFNTGKKDFSNFSFICKREMLESYFDGATKEFRNRVDPKYYTPRREEIEREIEETGCARSIGKVVSFEEEICPENEVNAFGSKYIDRITKAGVIEFGTIDHVNDPKGKKDRIFRKGDLVASRINLKSGMIAIVPHELDEIRGTNEYYKLVPKKEQEKELVLKQYLYIVLTCEPIQYLMHSRSTGQFGRLNDKELAKIHIPIYDIPTQESIVKWYEDESLRINELVRETEEKRAQLLNDKYNTILREQIFKSATKQESSNDLAWIASNPSELAQYEGKYVAIFGRKVLGFGVTSTEALENAKKVDARAYPLIMLASHGDLSLWVGDI